MSTDALPPATPPAYERKLTLEDLDRRVTALERHDTETYALLRDLGEKIDKNHLVTMDNLGELARMLGKVAKP